jgi:hypothetical protein
MTTSNDIRKFFSSPRAANAPDHQTANANTPAHRQLTPLQNNWRARRRIVESDSEEETRNMVTNAGVQETREAGRDDASAIVICTSDDDCEVRERPPIQRLTRCVSRMEEYLQEQSVVTPHAATPQHGRRRPATPTGAMLRSRRSRYEAEATEESTELSDEDHCAESDTDAEDLYRSAILSVRNAHTARQHLRARTTTCPVCAKLAAVLQHFL